MKKELKGFIVGCLTTAIISGGVAIASNQKTIEVTENNVTIIANGQQVSSPNFTYNDRTYVPLRAVLELMDCNITYDEETKTVYALNRYTDSYTATLKGTSNYYRTIWDYNDLITFVDSRLLDDTGFSFDPATAETNNLIYVPPASQVTLTPGSSTGSFPWYIFSGEETHEFLGKLSTNSYDRLSIANSYGDYGSSYSYTSIFNTYSDYGSAYSQYSAFNQYASNPPIITDSNFYPIGHLTTNTTFRDGYSLDAIMSVLQQYNQ